MRFEMVGNAERFTLTPTNETEKRVLKDVSEIRLVREGDSFVSRPVSTEETPEQPDLFETE